MTPNQLPNFKYIHNNTSDSLDVLLHGAGQGIGSSLMTKLVTASEQEGKSVVAISFPFFDRGENHSSGPELVEEITAVKEVLGFCHAHEYPKIRLLAKSLGGIVASCYLSTLPKDQQARYELVIFGFVASEERMADILNVKVDLSNRLTIIQGSKDKFGDIEVVKEKLKDSVSKEIKFISIENADHSYRDPETKEPVYEDEAVKCLFLQKT